MSYYRISISKVRRWMPHFNSSPSKWHNLLTSTPFWSVLKILDAMNLADPEVTFVVKSTS